MQNSSTFAIFSDSGMVRLHTTSTFLTLFAYEFPFYSSFSKDSEGNILSANVSSWFVSYSF